MKKNRFRRIAAISLTVALLLGCSVIGVFAADSSEEVKPDRTVTYSGGIESLAKLTISQDDFFANSKNIMPGEPGRTQTLRIENKGSERVLVWLKSEAVEELTDKQVELLNSLKMKITAHTEKGAQTLVYDGTAAGTLVENGKGDLTASGHGLSLGWLDTRHYATLEVTISAPTSLGNDFQAMNTAVDWVFVVEGIDEEDDISDESTPLTPPESNSPTTDDLIDITDDEIPYTGDTTFVLPVVLGLLLSGGVIVGLLVYKKKKV